MSTLVDEFFIGVAVCIGAVGKGIGGGIAAAAKAAQRAHERHLERQEQERRRVLSEAKTALHSKVARCKRLCENNIKLTTVTARKVMEQELKQTEASLAQGERALSQKPKNLSSIDITEAKTALNRAKATLKSAAEYSDGTIEALKEFSRGIDSCDNIKDLVRYSEQMPSTNEIECEKLSKSTDTARQSLVDIKDALTALSQFYQRLIKIDDTLTSNIEHIRLKSELNAVIESISVVDKSEITDGIKLADACTMQLRALKLSDVSTESMHQIYKLMHDFSQALASKEIKADSKSSQDQQRKGFNDKLAEAQSIMKKLRSSTYAEISFRITSELTAYERELSLTKMREPSSYTLAALDRLIMSLKLLSEKSTELEKKYTQFSQAIDEYIQSCNDCDLDSTMQHSEFKSRLLKSFDENDPDRSICRIREDISTNKRSLARIKRQGNLEIHKALIESKGWQVLTEEGSLDNVKRIVFCKKDEPRVLRILDIYATGKTVHMAVGIKVSKIVPVPIESSVIEVVSACSRIASESEEDLNRLISACPKGTISIARLSPPNHSEEEIYKRGFYSFDETNQELFLKFVALASSAKIPAYTAPQISKSWVENNLSSMSTANKAAALQKPL